MDYPFLDTNILSNSVFIFSVQYADSH